MKTNLVVPRPSRAIRSLFLLPAFALILAACAKESSAPNDAGVETGPPAIASITAEKTEILYGGNDPAILTCNATGGNLTYVWQVDLGDIIPLNASHSKVSFNGAACCVGEKTITCTVSNSKGSVSKSIVITILEAINPPEIISLEADKAQLSVGAADSASLVCYAIGGHLRYDWKADCGSIRPDPADSSKAVYRATTDCVGARTVSCDVSNEKGTDRKSLQFVITK
jgi:hypothetical protein